MKKIMFLLITTFFFFSTTAQTNRLREQYPIDKKREIYLGSIDIPEISVGVSFDTLTEVRSYANKFPNISNKALTYIKNGSRLQFKINCKLLSDIKNYRFVVVDDLKNILLSGRIEELRFTKHRIFGYSTELPIMNIQNKTISITIYNDKAPSQQGTAIVYNQVLPKTEITFIGKEVITHKPKGTAVEMRPDVAAFNFDQDTKGIQIAVKKNDYSFIYCLLVKEKESGKIVFKGNSWNYNYHSWEGIKQPTISIDKQYFQNPGDYEIIIRPELEYLSEQELEQHSSHKIIKIDIVKSLTVKELLLWSLLFIIIFIGITVLLVYLVRRKNEKKVREESLKKKISEAKLASIQSQLNPHFLFNALASIQSFVNENDVDNANRYLSKFARLTRNVLDSPSLNTLTDEQNLLADYLQMEQLRFGFKYLITTNDLDTNNIEMPTMLLQPLVENAIKHGISELKERGEINIYFEREENDLFVTVIDNGKGYDINHKSVGLGTRLTNERINLWNELHPQALISIATTSKNTGTSVSLTLKNWL